MMERTGEAASPRWMSWTGFVCSALPSLMLGASATMKLTRAPSALEGMVEKYGFGDGAVLGIGVVELLCTVLFLLPRTAVLGALLLTGYLGGATAIHVRAAEPFVFPIAVGVLIWAGLYLRDERVRELLPLRRGPAHALPVRSRVGATS